MLITAGIGLTPAAAVIRSILLRKWKKNYKPHYISFYWMVRQNEIKSFQWFVQLLAELEANVNRDRATGNVDPDNKGCEIHIYVTRVDVRPAPVVRALVLCGAVCSPECRGGVASRSTRRPSCMKAPRSIRCCYRTPSLTRRSSSTSFATQPRRPRRSPATL